MLLSVFSFSFRSRIEIIARMNMTDKLMYSTQIMSHGESKFYTINSSDSRKDFPIIKKVKKNREHFRLKIEEYLRTASFKRFVLILIKRV